MVIYEVNVEIAQKREAEFKKWIRLHIDDMLQVSGFEKAEIFRQENSNTYTIFYTVETKQKLEEYFRDHADKMRGEGVAKFGDSLRASRRILEKLG